MAESEDRVLQVSCAQMQWAGNLEDNLETTLAFIAEAKARGSDVVVFPEANLTGYDFEYVETLRAEQVRAAVAATARAAGEAGIYAIVCSLQKRGRGKYLNLAHVVDPEGRVCYEYAKIQMAGPGESQHCRPGNKLALFSVKGHLCTLAICRDGRHPEVYRVPAMAGAKVLFHPCCSSGTAEGVTWKRLAGRAQQTVGPTTYIYHCVANTVGQSRDGNLTSSGMSFITDPTGITLTEASWYQEELVTARLSLDRATARYPRASMRHPKVFQRLWKEAVAICRKHAADPVR